jgi:hypothetical protein
MAVVAVIAGGGGLGGVKNGCGAGNVIGNLGNSGGELASVIAFVSVLDFN